MPENDDFELRYLAGMLDVSIEKIEEAVSAVGHERADIEAFIKAEREKEQ